MIRRVRKGCHRFSELAKANACAFAGHAELVDWRANNAFSKRRARSTEITAPKMAYQLDDLGRTGAREHWARNRYILVRMPVPLDGTVNRSTPVGGRQQRSTRGPLEPRWAILVLPPELIGNWPLLRQAIHRLMYGPPGKRAKSSISNGIRDALAEQDLTSAGHRIMRR